MERKTRIEAAFSAAAAGYEAQAQAQVQTADLVVSKLPELPPAAKVLELGCGTGLLTRRLLTRLSDEAQLLATDLSPAMIQQTRESTTDPRLSLAVMDAEHPKGLERGFDLITSSLAAQWFTNLPATLAGLAGLLAPGGHLLIATLGARTFMEWRAAHAAQGLASGVPDYPDAAELAAMLPGANACSEPFTLAYDNARTFLRALESIGAHTPRPGHKPLSAGKLRTIMTALGSPCPITWDILILSFTKN